MSFSKAQMPLRLHIVIYSPKEALLFIVLPGKQEMRTKVYKKGVHHQWPLSLLLYGYLPNTRRGQESLFAEFSLLKLEASWKKKREVQVGHIPVR